MREPSKSRQPVGIPNVLDRDRASPRSRGLQRVKPPNLGWVMESLTKLFNMCGICCSCALDVMPVWMGW